MSHYAQGLLEEALRGPDSESALGHFREAAALDPGHNRLNNKLAESYLHQARADKAGEVLRLNAAQHPESFQAWVNLGAVYQLAGEPLVSLDSYRRAALLDPTRTAIHLALADLLFDLERDSEAMAALATGIRHAAEPERLTGYAYRRGLQFVENEETARSLPCFQFVAERLDAQHGQVYFLMGQLYEALGRMPEAMESYVQAAQQDPPYPRAIIRLALLHYEHEPVLAIQMLDEAQRAMPNELLLPFAKAQLLSGSGRFRESLPAYAAVTRILERMPGLQLPAAFYLHYGAAYERTGDFAMAEQVFEAGIRMHPDAHEILNYLAYMWAERAEHLDRALPYVERALVLDPENPAYLDTLGWVYFQQGRYPEALEYLEAAHRLLPEDPTITDHLGDVHAALGAHDQARHYWRESLRLDPANAAVAAKLADRTQAPEPRACEAPAKEADVLTP